MENFKKLVSEVTADNNVIIREKAFARGLVLFNKKSGATYAVAAKCRNTDKHSMCRALCKAVLADMAVLYRKNQTTAVQISQNKCVSKLTQALNSHVLYLADKDGNIIKNSGMSVVDESGDANETFRKMFRITASKPLYKLVVVEGRSWDDERVQVEIREWVNAAISNLSYTRELDDALANAATSNEAEYNAAQKAAKKAAKEAETKTEDVVPEAKAEAEAAA